MSTKPPANKHVMIVTLKTGSGVVHFAHSHIRYFHLVILKSRQLSKTKFTRLAIICLLYFAVLICFASLIDSFILFFLVYSIICCLYCSKFHSSWTPTRCCNPHFFHTFYLTVTYCHVYIFNFKQILLSACIFPIFLYVHHIQEAANVT